MIKHNYGHISYLYFDTVQKPNADLPYWITRGDFTFFCACRRTILHWRRKPLAQIVPQNPSWPQNHRRPFSPRVKHWPNKKTTMEVGPSFATELSFHAIIMEMKHGCLWKATTTPPKFNIVSEKGWLEVGRRSFPCGAFGIFSGANGETSGACWIETFSTEASSHKQILFWIFAKQTAWRPFQLDWIVYNETKLLSPC